MRILFSNPEIFPLKRKSTIYHESYCVLVSNEIPCVNVDNMKNIFALFFLPLCWMTPIIFTLVN